MPTLAEENRDLRTKVARLEKALGRATFELSKLSNSEEEMMCEEMQACFTFENPDEAINFYSEALGATEGFRVQDQDGKIAHAALQIGGSQMFVNSEYPELGKVSARNAKSGGGSAVAINLFVEDANVAFQRALQAGCAEVVPLRQTFWGDLTGTVVDPYGHQWILSTNKEPLSVGEILRRAEQHFSGAQA